MVSRQESIAGEILTRVLLVIIGLIILIPAANKLATYCSYRFFGTHTYGIVSHSSSGRDLGGRPLVQYKDDVSGLHEFKSRAKTHWFKRPVVGEKIEIFIDKNEPGNAIVNDLFYYVLLPVVFILAGFYCFWRGIIFKPKT